MRTIRISPLGLPDMWQKLIQVIKDAKEGKYRKVLMVLNVSCLPVKLMPYHCL